LKAFAVIVYLLNLEVLHKHIAKVLCISENAVTDYASLIREQCGRYLIDQYERLRGPGIRVQVSTVLILG
jgi:hypothetical protein